MTTDQAKLIAKKVRITLERERRAPKSAPKYPIYLSRSGMSRVVKFWKDKSMLGHLELFAFAIKVDNNGACFFYAREDQKQWMYSELLKHKTGYPHHFLLLQSEVEFHLDPIDPPRLRDLPEFIQSQLLVPQISVKHQSNTKTK